MRNNVTELESINEESRVSAIKSIASSIQNLKHEIEQNSFAQDNEFLFEDIANILTQMKVQKPTTDIPDVSMGLLGERSGTEPSDAR